MLAESPPRTPLLLASTPHPLCPPHAICEAGPGSWDRSEEQRNQDVGGVGEGGEEGGLEGLTPTVHDEQGRKPFPLLQSVSSAKIVCC